MPEDRTVSFEGFSAPLRGKVRSPASGAVSGALVLAHGRNGDMDEPLVEGLSRRTADLGWWTLRFNFAFADAKGEPSADTSDEIADLREAIAFARRESGAETVTIVGRGLGAWAVVAAATDEDAEDAILLGISYAGQEERRVALERLGEFDVPALIVVGSRSDRVDLPGIIYNIPGRTGVNMLPESILALADTPRAVEVAAAVAKTAVGVRVGRRLGDTSRGGSAAAF